MKPELIRVEPIALMPTPNGCAVFLGDGDKVIVFYIEPSIGHSINVILADQARPRPLSHDLFEQALRSLGAEVKRVVIHDVQGEIFYSRLILEAQNEIMARKIVELDARPSDAIAMAVRYEAPIYFVKAAWEPLKNMSDELERLNREMNEGE